LKKKTSTGSVNSSWAHFNILAPYLKKLAKVAGIPGAIDSGLTEVPSSVGFEQENFGESEGGEYVGVSAGEESHTMEQPIAEEQSEQAPSPKNSPALEVDRSKWKSTESGAVAEPDCQEISPVKKFEQKPGVNGQVNAKTKRFKGSPGASLARSIDNFTKVYAQMATKALEVEERIAKDKADTNLQMPDIKLKYQTELEKLRRAMHDS
jgi:hypothetical protein